MTLRINSVNIISLMPLLFSLVLFSGFASSQQLILSSTSTVATFNISVSNVFQWRVEELVNGSWATVLSGYSTQTGPYTITKPNGTYTYRLYNCNPYSTPSCTYYTSQSIEVAVAPSAPAPISAVPNSSSILVSWSIVSGASRYEWRRNSDAAQSGVALNFTDTTAVTGVSYTYSARACYSFSCSAWITSPSVKISSSSSSGSASSEAIQTFTYDALGRLTFVKDNRAGMNRDYDYDAAGNRTSVSVGTDSD